MKKKLKIYGLTISDESRLRRIARIGMPLWLWIFFGLATFAVVLSVAILLLAYTPLGKIVPGSFAEVDRELTMENILRLDSLQDMYEKDRDYLKNILTIFDTDREPTDSAALVVNPRPMTVDSLISRSPEEEKFIRMMEQREKYSLSILAPLAAEGMIFTPLSDESIITAESRKKNRAEVIVTSESPVGSIADGIIIDTYQSPSTGGNTVIIQHNNGFASRIGRLGSLMVSRGDYVHAGQIIAFPQTGRGRNTNLVTLEIWRNSEPLIPAELIGS